MNSKQIQKKTYRETVNLQNQKNYKPTYYKNLNQNLSKLEQHKKNLPELNYCDMIINHWSKELLSLFTDVRKWWEKGQHVSFKDINLQNSFLYVSSTLDIINNENNLPFNGLTYILIGKPTSNNCVLFNWKVRFNQSKWNYLEKIDSNSFRIYNVEKEKIINYKQSEQVGLLNELQRFQNMSLVSDCIQKTRKLGTQKSNQNSSAQKLRRGKKLLLQFDCPNGYNEEIKDMLDSYKIVSGKYNYKKSYRTFTREIKENKIMTF